METKKGISMSFIYFHVTNNYFVILEMFQQNSCYCTSILQRNRMNKLHNKIDGLNVD
jgi:hypothetical protein